MTVTQIVRIRPQEGKSDDVEPYLRRLVEAASNEVGTLIYLMNRKDDEFVMYEMYKDEASMNLHNENEALHQLGARAGELLTAPPAIERVSYLAGTGQAS
ncbi:putative quinol monooxygenase [Amycolatopsis sp. NPDC005232]|uniref:putative quinol monooxygenase n=1 Tax=Amycolatopsis sp. NPDC005232 TaxID=3157027 RepID=UPI0033A4511C